VNEQDVFILTDQALNAVVGQIRDDQWDSRVPDDMAPRQPGMTLRQIVNYHATMRGSPTCSRARP
jgi:hypothetical protein